MMEDINYIVSESYESTSGAHDAAEIQECVNSVLSAEQGSYHVNQEHTTHFHAGETADFDESVFLSNLKGTHPQTHCISEHLVHCSENVGCVSVTIGTDPDIKDETENESNAEFQVDTTTMVVDDDNTLSSTDVAESKKEKFDIEKLNYELQVGYKILVNLMGAGNRFVNKLFLYPVDDKFPETADYYSQIKEPMCMTKMKEKFECLAYNDLTEFMADFKLMIENCYRFNGPDNFVSKKAQKLETMMKQKIALLSKDLREKLLGSVNTDDDILASAGIRRRIRNPNANPEDESQVLLSQLRRDKAIREREDRKQRSEDKKALEVARIQEIQKWEDEFIGEDIKESLQTMWELPQIGLFVYLCMECLGLEEEVTQYQLERGLVAPRESSDFRRLMTCLLSTQHQRKSVKSFMPYNVWNKKLCQKLDYFYKVLADCGGNHQQACYKLGFDNRAFKVMGKSNPLLRRQFHQLSFLKRVWIMKNYCDHCVDVQTYLQKTIEETEAERPMDVREVLLGSDGRGNRYINFPMFTGKDIRIYRYPKLQEPSLSSLGLEDWSMVEDKPSASSSRCSTPVNQRSGRCSEPQSSSLRARAILQAAESNDPSPSRDVVRSSPDLQDENSNSNQGASSISSETHDTVRNRGGGPYKKRKKSNFFGRRKRLKTGNRKELAVEDFADSPGTEKDEDGSVRDEEDSQGFNVPKFNATNKPTGVSGIHDADCDTMNNGCGVNSQEISPILSIAADGKTSSQSVSVSESSLSLSSTSLNYANVTNGVSSLPAENECDPKDKGMLEETHQVLVTCSNTAKTCDNAQGGVIGSNEKRCQEEIGSREGVAENQIGSDKMRIEVQTSESKCINSGHREVVLSENDSGNSKTHDSAYLSCDNERSLDKIDDENGDISSKDLKVQDGDEDITKKSIPKQFPCDKIKEESEKEANGDLVKEEARDLSTGEKKVNETISDIKMECHDTESQADDNSKTASFPYENEDRKVATQKAGDIQEQPSMKTELDIKEEEESDEDDLPDLGRIELVAESMEEIKGLMNKLSNPEPIKRGKRVYPGVMKPCEEELFENLTRFHTELLKYERSLFNARVHAQVKLRKEVENYSEPKPEESKAWESESSQSSKASSDDEDADVAKKENSVKLTKKSKSKSLTTELLSSAASKLLSLNGDDDSNDSYELDISSRGRLRKRRVIPNNTEDTGMKKRKNLNQESVSTTASSSPSSSTPVFSMTSTTPSMLHTNTNMSSAGLREAGKTMPSQILSMLNSSSPSSSCARPQHSSNKVMPCQIVRLVSPSGDSSAYKTVRLTGSPNVLLSPEKFANIQFISSTGVITIPKGKILTSGTQSSHPVIQNLLMNQGKNTASHVTVQSVSAKNTTTSDVNKQGGQLLAKLSSNQSGHSIKVTTASSTNQSPVGIKSPSKMASRASAAVVVTQVSNSFISQGGKQVLDLGSLSVTQIQQLVKNQAIQINTGAGNPTTLLLTTGLQQLVTSKGSNVSVASTTLASATISSGSQVKGPAQFVSQTPVGSNLSSIKNHMGHMTVIPRNSSSQLPVIRTIINRPALNPNRTMTSTVIGPSAPACQVVCPNPQQQLGAVSRGTLTVVPGGTALKQIPSPRIISSLNQSSIVSSVGPNTANKENPFSINNSSVSSNSKPNWVSIPMPQKKYSCNVTVKALLENRSAKKSDNDGSTGMDVDGERCDSRDDGAKHSTNKDPMTCMDQAAMSGNAMIAGTTNNEQVLSTSVHAQTQLVSLSQAPLVGISSSSQANTSSCVADSMNIAVKNTNVSPSVPVTQCLSVDAAIQPLMFSSVQVSLPTVNMKVPSPNTLPSMTHNKHSTTIVQSTKVPIPVVSTVDSHSPLAQPSTGIENSVNIPPSSISGCHPSAVTSNTLPSKTQTVSITSPANQSSGNVNPNTVANVKNVMLKLTPPKGGTGQFVQGYMTSQGKLVIPQGALFPQQSQQPQGQVIQAGPNRVILANTTQAVTLQPGHIQPKATTVIVNGTNGSPQVKIAQQNNIAVNQQNPAVQILGQQNNQLILANAQQANSAPTNVTARAIPVPSGNPGIKLMLINPSAVPGMQNVQQSNIVRSVATTFPSQQQAIQTSTPASELVKQIANSTQLQAATAQQQQKQLQVSTSTSKPTQVVTQAVQPNTSQVIQTITGQGQTTGVSQLAAQILALQQQGNKTIQFQQPGQQQVQGGVVLAKPAALHQAQGNQTGAISVQLQQFNPMLQPSIRGITQVQVPNSQLQQGTLMAASKPVQQAQMLQLAINSQNANARTVLAQPAARVVQVAGQLSPQIQLTSQNPLQAVTPVNPVPQQVGLIIQQPTVLQPTQQIIRPQGGSVVHIQQNNTVVQQQKPQQQQVSSLQQQHKQPQILSNTQVRQQLNLPPASNNQPQIQFVINQSASSNMTSSSPTNINLARLNNPIIHPVIRAVATSAMSTPSSSSVSHLTPQNIAATITSTSSSLSSPPQNITTVKQVSQVVSQNLSTSNQFIISPIKLPPESTQTRLVSPIKLVSPIQTILQSGSLTDHKTNQLVIQNTSQLHNVSSKSLPQVSQPLRMAGIPSVTNLARVSMVQSGKETSQIAAKSNTVVYKIEDQQTFPGSVSGNLAGSNATVAANAASSLSSMDDPSNQILGVQGQQVSVNEDMTCSVSPGDVQNSQISHPASNGNLQPSQSAGLRPNIVYEMAQHDTVGRLPQHQSNVASHIVRNGTSDSGILSNQTASSRRNTFGGSQEVPKLLVQRQASVEESVNQSRTSEMDEKEAALNLLTLANQPL